MVERRREVAVSESEVVDGLQDGMTIGLGGFNTAAHPMAIVREIVRRDIRRLRVVGATIAGLEIDLLISAGCVEEVVTSAVTAEGIASVGPMFGHAVESGDVKVWECDEGIMYAGLRAAGQGLPFLPWKAGLGTSIPDLNAEIVEFEDPIEGTRLIAVPPIPIDIAFIHVDRSDAHGLGQHAGSGFGDRSLHRAAKRTVLTAESLIPNEEVRKNPRATSIPHADGVVYAPWGAHPFSSPNRYRVDEEHIIEYLEAARQAVKGNRGALDEYLDRYVTGPADHAAYLEEVGVRRLIELSRAGG